MDLGYSLASLKFNTNFPKGTLILFISLVGTLVSVFLYQKSPVYFGISLMLLAALLVVRFKVYFVFYGLLSLSIPLSLELELGSTKIFFPSEPLIGIAVLAYLFGLLWGHFKLIQSSKDYVLLSFPLLLLILSFFSEDIIISFKYSLIISSYTITFYFLGREVLFQKGALKLSFLLLMSGLVLTALWSIYQFALRGFSFDLNRIFFRPFFTDHTLSGAVLAFASSALIVLLATNVIKRRNRFWVGLMLVLFLVCLWIGQSRAAIISLPIGLFVAAFVLNRHLKKLFLVVIFIGISLVVLNFNSLVSSVYSNNSDSGKSNSSLTEQVTSVYNVSNDVSNLERINRWVTAWDMFLLKPITGFGPGTYQYTYIPFQRESLKTRMSITNPYIVKDGHGGTAHSEFLLALSEGGVFLFLSYLSFLFLWGSSIYKTSKSESDPLIAALLAGLGTLFFHSLFNNFLNVPMVAFLFWSGMAIIIYYPNRNEGEALN
jgi:O-antigen ligase